MEDTWFLFDLGNTIIKLAYERVLAAICTDASMSRDELVELLEEPGAYRDMERDDGRYIDDAYISSFAGFAPANDPRFVVVIVLERPQSKLLGTVTAMSTFRNIAQDALRSMRVQPDRP